MQFHRQVFGANVRLSEDCTSAWRRSPERSFCDSLVFSDRPLIYCHPIRIHLQSTPIHGWKGGASIGLTCHEPATFCAARNTAEDDATTETALPSLATPIGLCEQSGVWLRPLPTECLNRLLHIILQPHATGIELIVIMTSEQKYSLLSSLPVQDPLWLVIDLFGQSYRVDLVQSIDTESISCQLISHNSTSSTNGHGTKTSKEDDTSEPTNKDGGAKDEPSLYTKEHPFKQLQDDKDLTLLQIRHVPATVLSGGPKALETYTNECKDGAVLYNSVRLFLIGPSGGGKSTLRQQLIGGSNPNSIGSNVICRARSDGNGNWNSDLPKTNEEDADGDPDSDFSSSPDPETVQKMEQQAYEQLAFNLARLLLLQQVKDTSLQQLPVARLQQLIRVDCNESPATPTANETEPSIPGSGHGLSHAIKAVLRFPIKSTKIVAERRFDDIRQSEVESEDENALPLKLRKLIEELLLNPEGLVKPNESVAPPSFTCKEHFYEIWDLPGAFMYFMLNQTLLSANAIYIFVMDVSKEIEPDTSTVEAKSNDASKSKPDTGDSSTATESSATSDVLNEFHVWLGALHVQLSDVCSFDPQQPLQPKVILVASHRNSLHKQPLARDAALRELFEKVRQSVSGRPYESLLSPNYFALDLKKMSFDEPQRLTELRTAIDQTSLEQRLLSSYVPISWLRLQRCLERLAGRGVHFVARSQLLQLLSSQFEPQQMLLNSTCSLHTALAFMQSNGKLLGFGPEVGSGLVSDTSGPLWSQGNDCACYACSNCAQYGSNCPATTAAHFNGTNGSHSTYSNTRNRSLNGFDCTCENNYYHKCSDQVANPCLDSTDWMLVLQPHWLLGCCYRLCAFVLRLRSEHRDALVSGVLREQLLDRCWADRFEQKHVLVGCLERLDLLCELRPYIGSDETPEITSNVLQSKVYIFPWITQVTSEPAPDIGLLYDMNTSNSLRLVLLFEPLLPVGLYTRLVLRMCRWSWTQGWGRRPEISQSESRFAIDFDHDVVLKIDPKRQLVQLILIKIYEHLHNEMLDGPAASGPTANVCVKLRHLVECEMSYLQAQYYRRISWTLMVICPCELECKEHAVAACEQDRCIHFLSLSECLSKKVVECDYRQVRTTFISRFFPHNLFLSNPLDSNGSNEYHAAHPRIQRQASEVMPPTGSHSEGAFAYLAHLFSGHRNGAPMSQSPGASATSVGPSFHFGSPPNNSSVPINTAIPYTAEQFLGWDAMFSPEPSWMREAARQLHTITDAGRDWSALARRLGYSNREIRRIRDDDSQLPALSLLRDWFESNGRSSYCVDVLSSCLRLISREDVLRLLDSEKASESLASPVFLSYQSASQAAALQLRRRLELNGFGCWMDVQQMSGGDQLFTRIYDGLARCRLVICCLTARYCASRTCVRELTLADALHKPILPLLLEPLPWPPPGPLALILSPLLYVDLCGVGGHGGIGRRQDRESRMREIVERVGRYVSEYAQMPAVFGRPLPLPDLFSQVQQPSGGRLGVDPPLSAMYAARLGSGHSGNSDRSMSSHQTDTFDETNVPHRSPSAHHDSDQPSTSTGERHLDTVQPIEDDDDDDDDEDLDILSNRDRLNSRVHHNRNDSNSANQTTHASDSDSNNERNTQHLTPGQASTSVQTQTASPLDNPVASTAHAAIHTRSVSTSPEVDSVITITRESASSSTSAPPHESAVQSALAEAPRTNNRISNCSICCIS